MRGWLRGRTTSWKSLDYVAGWFMKAANYGTQTNSVAAFVSTNSICQGQQVSILWPLIFGTEHVIAFAHTSFKWANLASHNAGVTVAIVGISNHAGKIRRLFSIAEHGRSVVKEAENINAYLVSGPNVIVAPEPRRNDEIAKMEWGNKPTDGGNLILSTEEKDDLISSYPSSSKSHDSPHFRLLHYYAQAGTTLLDTAFCIRLGYVTRGMTRSVGPASRCRWRGDLASKPTALESQEKK